MNRCQEKVEGTVQDVILVRLKENSILVNEISEHTWNEELDKPIMVTSQSRENYTRLSITWRSRTQNLERRNSEYALLESQRELESQRQQLLIANHWADQAQRERIHSCRESEMRSHPTRKATQEVAKKLKN